MNPLAFVTANIWRVFAIVLIACLPVSYCKGRAVGVSVTRAQNAVVVIAAAKRNETAKDIAAIERKSDDQLADQSTKELTDAIQEFPDTAPDAVRVALGCERLRRAPGGHKQLPAVCGPARPAQAAPRH